MIAIFFTKEFRNCYAGLALPVQKKAEKQERLFRQNPFHPSLHTEKLNPKSKEVWSFRIDKKHRVLFRFIASGKALFLTVGPHNWIYSFAFYRVSSIR